MDGNNVVSAQFYVSLKKYKEAQIKGAVTKQEMVLCSEDTLNFAAVDAPK